jgi:hypothetical protein
MGATVFSADVPVVYEAPVVYPAALAPITFDVE